MSAGDVLLLYLACMGGLVLWDIRTERHLRHKLRKLTDKWRGIP